MPGGKIAPDGRPPVAPGVGKTARRHDLEAPATPGLHDSDLQQGDVQALEQSQKVAPRAKRQQPAASPSAPNRQRQAPQRGSGQFSMETPDPIEMAGGRIGGNIPSTGEGRFVDPSPWMPLLSMMANSPNTGGAITAGMVDMLSQYRRSPVVSQGNLIDLNEIDNALEG